MMRNSRLRWLLGLMAALSLIAAACGDDSGGGGDEATGGDGGGEEVTLPECLDFPALYALTGPESTGFTNWSDATALADQVGSAYGADFPDAPLDITGPGEESGTYDSYVSFAIEPIAEAQGLPEEEWVTRPDYTSSPNDNVIIEGVEGSSSSFGWVGFAFAEEAGDQVREFEIAGDDGTCVAPNADTIASGDYPMSRPLYIYVSQASLADNPAVAAYVDFYLGDEGYQAVADAGYVQVDEGTWGETQSAWSDAGGSPGEPASGVSGDVVVSGSSTVEPISSAIAESFSADNSGVSISVDGPGTGDGFELFCAGETDISDASRAIEDEEAQACADAGIEYVELYIGIDGLSVLTAG